LFFSRQKPEISTKFVSNEDSVALTVDARHVLVMMLLVVMMLMMV